MVGIRCFDDTGDLSFGSKFNIFVGQNNAGKSTILRGLLSFQGFPMDQSDFRKSVDNSWTSISLGDVLSSDIFSGKTAETGSKRLIIHMRGSEPNYNDLPTHSMNINQQWFHQTRPQHVLVPFLAKRKASGFSETINASAHSLMSGLLNNLYAGIDVLATAGHPEHDAYLAATREILGLTVTTKPSINGKVAGFYLDAENFVTLDRMGDGVTETIALITELCLARNKVFVLEEPETNLHPRGLKALLKMVRASAEYNQFFIATHSNVVVRELGGEDDSIVYRVFRDGDTPQSPSCVEQVERTPEAHMRLLRELGYEFTDFELHEGWLFLEESSAERIIRDILIPYFVPKLRGRLRTFAAGGVNNLEPSVAEFRRLITFVHLQPAYEGRLWVRADGDDAGLKVVESMRQTFPDFDETVLTSFAQSQFEYYYPEQFRVVADQTLAIPEKQQRRRAKIALLEEVLIWTKENKEEAKLAWEISAAEPINLLKLIAKTL